MRTLVVTDLHFTDKPLGLLDAQRKCIERICEEEQPEEVIIMGDLVMHRRPSPSVLLALKSVIDKLVNNGTAVFLLRGNHDSETKADNGITALSLFDDRTKNVKVITHTWIDGVSKRVFIPHYEDEFTIKKVLEHTPEDYCVFGHFGYDGCLNSAGDIDFTISFSEFRSPTCLGHIHRFNRKKLQAEGSVGEVVLLGTPYTTNFGECGKDNRYAVMQEGEVEYKKVTHGPRHIAINYKELVDAPDVIEYLNDPEYFTMLRVLRDRDDENVSLDLLDVASIDIKWSPTTEEVIDGSDSYNPSRDLFSINEVILEDYVDSVETTLTKEQIMGGYTLIKHED